MLGKWAQVLCRRREPLEKRRDGLVESHRTTSMLLRFFGIRNDSKKGVNNLQVIDFVPGVHVFGVKGTASALHCGANNHRIPIPEMMKLMEVYSCENIAEIWLKPQQPREKCNALLCKPNV